jgi:hypothetical protein
VAAASRAKGPRAQVEPLGYAMLGLTTDFPLLLVGTVQARRVMRGKSDKGDWEMRIEIRGQDGRVQNAVINDLAGIPPQGEFVVLPVYVG